MAVWAIADLHLSSAFRIKKWMLWPSMIISDKIEERWRALISDGDTVLIRRYSWQCTQNALPDFKWINSLPIKFLIKGKNT